MRRLVLTLAVLGVLGVATNQARADGALSHPVAATYAVQRADHDGGPVGYHQVRHYRHRHHPGYGPVIGHPYAPRYPAVVVPYPRPYYPRPYYYYPGGGFSYSGPGVSIGIGW